MLYLLALAVAPALFLLLYLYARDTYEREPLHLVMRTFFAGALAVLPVLLLDFAIAQPAGLWLIGPDGPGALLWTAFITAGLVEELCKLGAVWRVAYRHPQFNEPYDGVLYSAAAALGFATLENILYVLGAGAGDLRAGYGVGFVRALLAVPGHGLFGIIMGHYIGRAKFATSAGRRASLWLLALVVPVVLHGLYDVLALNTDYAIAVFLMFPLVAYLWVRGTRAIDSAVAASPFRPVGNTGTFQDPCSTCGTPLLLGANFCHHCGQPAHQRVLAE